MDYQKNPQLRRRKRINPMVAGLSLLCFALAILITLLVGQIEKSATPLSEQVFSTDHAQRIAIKVTEKDTIESVAMNLEKNAIIRTHKDFIKIIEEEYNPYIAPGEYRLSAAMPLKRIAGLLTRPHSAERSIHIYAGTTLRDIAVLFEEADICSQKTFWQVSKNGQFEGFDFLPKKGSSKLRLEGFIFPGTYEYEDNMDPEQILSMMLDSFESAYKKIPRRTNHLSNYETIILASMLQKEARTDGEKPTIASVYINRLKKDMPLQCDATIIYDKPGHVGTLTFEDYKYETPYNTYLHKGFPPTPISNVNLPSLIAASDPAKTDYLFYLYNTQSKNAHVFAKTYQEHLKNRKIYGYD